MTELAIQFNDQACHHDCGICGGRMPSARGPQLLCVDRGDAVCRACGKLHAPALVALLDLARIAERVGRIGQHTLVPPITALLDLARAAEEYTTKSPAPCRQAA